MADRSQQTEKPTQRRLEKARKEGQFLSARELVSALQFLVFVALLAAGGGSWWQGYCVSARRLFGRAFAGPLTVPAVTRLAWDLCWLHVAPLALAGGAVALATVGFRMATTRGGLSLKKLAPDAARFNPLAKLRELPSQNLPSLLQAAILMPVFFWAVYGIARDHLEGFLLLPLAGVQAGLAAIGAAMKALLWKAAGLFLVFGVVDLFRQYRRYQRDLRMSKQEVRDEMKETEGNPQMKGRIRRLQREKLRRRMMEQVPEATAVVVNPTHYAVALRYAMDSMAAPVVVAKGKNWLALRIRRKAMEHQIPIIENPPLAQALYLSAEVGQEIPAQLYRAVAEVLAYVFKLMHGRHAR